MAASAYHVISKKVENQIFRHNWIFRHVCMNKPHWQSSGIIIFLFKCYIVISYTLVSFFLDVLFLLLAVMLSELYEKPRKKKDWVAEKSTKKNLCEGHHFLWLHILPTMSFFVAFFVYSPAQVTYLLNEPNESTLYFYGWYSVW